MSGSYLGAVLYGYCEGYFGRDSYGVKVVRDFGKYWVFVTDEGYGEPNVARFKSAEEMVDCLARWSSEAARLESEKE